MNNEQDEISLGEIMQMMLRRKKVIIATFLILFIASSAFAFIPKTDGGKFDAKSSLVITYVYNTPTNPEEIGEGYVYYQDRISTNVTPVIKSYTQSLTLLETIISELDIRDNEGELISARKLSEKVKIEEKSGNLMSLTVSYDNHQIAKDIANLIPQKLVEFVKSSEGLQGYTVTIIDKAFVEEIEGTSKILIPIIGAVLGLMLGVLLAFIKENTDKKIRTKSDILSQGLPVEIESSSTDTKDLTKSIINSMMLSNSKSATLMLNDENDLKLIEGMINSITDSGIDIKILDYTGKLNKAVNILADESILKAGIINFGGLKNKITDFSEDNSIVISIISNDLESLKPFAKASDITFVLVYPQNTTRTNVVQIGEINKKYNLNIKTIWMK